VKKNGLLLNPKDSVVTVMEEIPEGATVYFEVDGIFKELTAKETIKKYHKIAAIDIAKGQSVIRYGENIGHAISDIKAGNWVHTHNLSDIPEV